MYAKKLSRGSGQTRLQATKALGTVVPVLDQYDEENDVLQLSGTHPILLKQKKIVT